MKRMLFTAVIFALLASGMGCLAPQSSDTTAADVEDRIFQLVNQQRVSEGLAALVRTAALDDLAKDYATSQFSDGAGGSSDILYLVSNAWQLDFSLGSPRLDDDTASEQVEYCLDQLTMRDALLKQEAMETGVGIATVGNTIYFTQVFDVIRTSGGAGQPIILTENPEATDPTWEQLEAFLVSDTTDEVPYVLGSFICGDFAETLHNNAEATGIRAAYVPVRLNQEPGHALNAFNVDGTTVFIDAIAGDKVAYVEVGKDYGVIKLDAAEEFTYTYFETYVTRFETYQEDFIEYNAQVEAYNGFEDPPAPYTTRNEWAQALNERLAELNEDKVELGLAGSYFHPTESLVGVEDPTVVDYYIHW